MAPCRFWLKWICAGVRNRTSLPSCPTMGASLDVHV